MKLPVDVDCQVRVLRELEPVVAENLNRHLSVARDWNPHDYVPWSEGRNFGFLGGDDWEPDQSRLEPAVRASMVVNLLTEDNLPSYHRDIATTFGRDGAWGEWVNRWTAEEARHGAALRDYLVVTRAVDPVDLERRRLRHMSVGTLNEPEGVLENLAYTAFQELATRLAHRNTGAATGCPIGDQLLARIAADENLHLIFYRNTAGAALDIAPDDTLIAIRNAVLNFEMPGASQPDFHRFSVLIANHGIYDLRLHHDKVVMPILRHWKIFERNDLTARGEQVREELADFLGKLDERASRFVERRAQRQARATALAG
ncbi:acyl-ACP desaturase [Micromonospora sp. RTGN7]|uniref:acyl-ACP desaturase n=1 Tax=Micromonospora sp. RTGN7 TaxID=3016526 RepID=UPI0029FF20E1|nr:acyl-ACP desaturase [Micromonospora sp. RTGN7]